MCRAHRVAYELHHGVELTADQHILHSCDHPPCVNPNHLRVGTNAENVRDCMEKGRRADKRGENGGRHVLTTEQVLEIRASAAGCTELARLYGVTKSTISAIRLRRLWAHVE